jgi:DNA-3-methyladenine glycosylase I
VRHRGKIEAVINNSRRAVEMVQAEGSLARYIWRFEPEAVTDRGEQPVLSQTADSKTLSKDLKRRGWRFVGPTTAYAFMQAMGLVNDHRPACEVRVRADRARERFQRP